MRQLLFCIACAFYTATPSSVAPAQTPPSSRSLDAEDPLNDAAKQATPQRLSKAIHQAGVVESADVNEIRSHTPGLAIIVSIVPNGSQVKAGDLLVELDDSAIRRTMAEQSVKVVNSKASAERAVAAVEDQTERYKVLLPYAQLKLHAAELARQRYLSNDGEYALDVSHAERQITLAENRLEIVEEQKKASPRSREMEWAMDDAKTELQMVEDAKKLLTNHVREHETTLLDAALGEANADLAQIEIDVQNAIQSARGDVQAQQLAYDLEYKRFEDLQLQLEDCRIRAPRDGVIVYTASTARRGSALEPGSTVQEHQLLMTMPNLEKLIVRVNIDETQIPGVQIGQPVTLHVAGFPDQKISGRVTEVARVPNVTFPMPGDAVEYGVHVTLDKPPAELRLGMSVMAEIHLEP